MVTIQIYDRHGDTISAVKDPLMNQILVTLPDSEPFWVDPNDPDAMAWLKKVFGEKVNYL